MNKEINILLVDDSIGIRLMAKKIFRNLGFRNVSLADDGDKGLDALREDSFDLVIADWSMPRMSGLDMVREMRKDETLKDIPVLLVTGDDEQDNMLAALKAGVNNVMTKPYDASVLSRKIEQIFAFQEKLKQRGQNT